MRVSFAIDGRRGREILRLERELARLLRQAQDRLTAPLLETLRRLETGGPLTPSQGAELLARLDALGRGAHLVDSVVRRLQRLAERVAAQGQVDAVEEMREVAGPWSVRLPEPRVSAEDVAWYRERARAAAERVVADHYPRVREAVVAGLRRSETDRQLADRLRALQLGLSRAQAQTWARTESTRCYTLGRVRSIEEAGELVWGYAYVVIVDEATTPLCRGFIGKRVAKGRMRLLPPFHWGCRTTVRAVLVEGVTGEPEQPAGTELPPEARPAEGFGADPRGVVPGRPRAAEPATAALDAAASQRLRE